MREEATKRPMNSHEISMLLNLREDREPVYKPSDFNSDEWKKLVKVEAELRSDIARNPCVRDIAKLSECKGKIEKLCEQGEKFRPLTPQEANRIYCDIHANYQLQEERK